MQRRATTATAKSKRRRRFVELGNIDHIRSTVTHLIIEFGID